MNATDQRPTYKLTLRAPPGAVPEVVRLRRLLKALLRGYGLVCLDVEEVPRQPLTPPAGRVD